MIRLLLVALAGYVAYRVAKHWLRSSASSARREGRPVDNVDDLMVKCPQCGSFFPRRDGIAHGGREGEKLLCSSNCREALIAADQRVKE